MSIQSSSFGPRPSYLFPSESTFFPLSLNLLNDTLTLFAPFSTPTSTTVAGYQYLLNASTSDPKVS